MVRLNKNILSEKQLEKLYRQFAATVAPKDMVRARTVLGELLGREERVMVAKRLATAVLLTEGMSRYQVSQLLKLSQSTVQHIAQKIEQGDFDHTLRRVSKTKKDYFAFLHVLDQILHLGGVLPHYNGLDRYKNIR